MSKEPLVYVNVIRRDEHVLVAVCDRELLGKKLSFGDVELEVRESFYGGRLTTVGEAIEIIRTEATIANLMGTDIVSEAIKAGLIHPDATISIGGVLHAQLIKLTSR